MCCRCWSCRGTASSSMCPRAGMWASRPTATYAEKVPHPVPARRAKGRTRHRLIPDASRVPAVTSLWGREEALCAPVSRFFATHVFGPDRRTHLKAVLEAARVADGTGARTAKERPALEQAIKAIGERQAQLIRTLADGGFDLSRRRSSATRSAGSTPPWASSARSSPSRRPVWTPRSSCAPRRQRGSAGCAPAPRRRPCSGPGGDSAAALQRLRVGNPLQPTP